MTTPKIEFTEHAVDRYMQYYDSAPVERDAVKALLSEHGARARKLKEKPPKGGSLWLVEGLGITLVTKPHEDRHVCVTILPPPELRSLGSSVIETIQNKISELEIKEGQLHSERESAVAAATVLLEEEKRLQARCVSLEQGVRAKPPTPKQDKLRAAIQDGHERKKALAERRSEHTRQVEVLKLKIRLVSEEREIYASMRRGRIIKILMNFVRSLPKDQTAAVLRQVREVHPQFAADDVAFPIEQDADILLGTQDKESG